MNCTDDFLFNSTCTFSCDTGYDASGTAWRSCRDSRQWSGYDNFNCTGELNWPCDINNQSVRQLISQTLLFSLWISLFFMFFTKIQFAWYFQRIIKYIFEFFYRLLCSTAHTIGTFKVMTVHSKMTFLSQLVHHNLISPIYVHWKCWHHVPFHASIIPDSLELSRLICSNIWKHEVYRWFSIQQQLYI